MDEVADGSGFGEAQSPFRESKQCNFHVHSEGSFLDGFSRVEHIAKRAKELGQSAVALTDHGEVNQHLAFQKACLAEGVKPIFGMEGYWAPDIQAARDASLLQRDFISHICLIAHNDVGLKNLWAISSAAYEPKNFYRKPLADLDLLRQHSNGLYASDGCLMTLFGQAVKRGDDDAARQYLASLQSVFGERFYVELHTWQWMNRDETEVTWEGSPSTTAQASQLMTDLNQAKVRFATEMGIPMVVVNDSHHAYPQHWRFKELVWGFKNDSNSDQVEGKGQKADHMMADDELYFWMDRHGISREVVAEAIDHSAVMAATCDVEIKPMLGMPVFSKSEADDFELFLELVERGFRDKIERGGLNRDLYWRRMESEVSLIATKRFAGYFLIVQDYVQAARQGTWASYVNGGPPDPMMIGPGRGSAGGSLVAWLLGITSIDPIKYGLLFERFLIPERKGFPDIDIDFPRSKRAGIKEYVKHRWGYDHVCSICFAGSERFLTRDGTKTFAQTEGTSQLVLGRRGEWTQAEIKSFGIQKLYRLTVSRYGREKEILTTAEHRWFRIRQGKDGAVIRSKYKATEECRTLDLQFGDELRTTFRIPHTSRVRPSAVGIQAGIVFGDGTIRRRSGMSASVQLFGEKDAQLLKWFPLSPTQQGFQNEVPWTEVADLPGFFKDRPPLRESFSYLYGWLAGYFAADGTVSKIGAASLSSTKLDDLQCAQDVCHALGIRAYGVKSQVVPVSLPQGGRTGESIVRYTLNLETGDLTEDFFLISEHRLCAGARLGGQRLSVPNWRVKSVEPLDQWESVYCAVVPDGQSFVLDGNILTGNCTMSRNQARGTIKDLGRQLGIDYQELEKIGKLVERFTAAEIEEEESSDDREERPWAEVVAENSKELAPWVAKYPALFQDANDLVGVIRQTGVHAAAVLITPADKPLREVLPTRIKNGILTTQFDMYDVEELGGLKGDFLALRHLDALQIAADLIKERHGVDIDYESFDETQYNDPAIWTQIEEGQTVGIFQLGTPGGTDSAIEFRPRSMVDVADLISINRPGVRDAGLYHAYLRRRAGVEEVTYQHPLMELITKDTYGILIYQEQLMQTARELAGFTASEASDLQKAVSKKVMEKVLAHKEKFIQGCQNNYDYALACGDPINQTMNEKREVEIAETIWRSIEASGRYLFNKSHALGYALIATWEIWDKHYYPPEILLGFLQVDEAKRNRFIRDARRLGIPILPPDINASGKNFTLVGDSIRYGLNAVSKVGDVAADAIIAGQPYTSLEDYLTRAGKGAYKASAINLAMVGALDCLGDRTKVLKEMERHWIIKSIAPRKRATLTEAQKDAIVVDKLERLPKYRIEVPDFTREQVLYAIEQELVGSFVTIDPMGKYVAAIDGEAIKSPAALRRFLPGQKLKIGGEVIKVRTTKTKKGRNPGQEMAFLGVEWQGDVYDIVVFPRVYDTYRNVLEEGTPVLAVCERLDDGVCLNKLYRLDHIWGEFGR